jgi:putative effector of murein hydrolase
LSDIEVSYVKVPLHGVVVIKPGRIAFLSAVLVYFGLVAASLWLLSLDTLTQAYARYTIALLPLGPATVMVVLAVRRYQRLDELAQRIHLLALAVAFVGTSLLIFTWSVFEFFGLFERFGLLGLMSSPGREGRGGLLALGVMFGLYLIGWIWARRRYR